jgi:ketosteroid isomerase-like protein
MKKLGMVLSFVWIICFIVGCQQSEEIGEEPVVDVAADVEAIRNWVDKSYAAADSGDYEGYMSFWAEGVIWMPPNASIIQGIHAATEIVRPYFEQVIVHHEISIEEIEVAGDFAFIRIISEETYTPRTGDGDSSEASFKVIILLQRMVDATWLGTHLIWNSNDPPLRHP